MKRWALTSGRAAGMILLVLVVGCGASEQQAELEQRIEELEGQLAAQESETTAEPTTTSAATTTTARPTTATTLTATTIAPVLTLPAVESVVLSGSGKMVLPVPPLSEDHVVLEVTLGGSGTVTLQSEDGEQEGFLWATGESYQGETVISDPSVVSFVAVDPDDSQPWQITIRALAEEDIVQVPGRLSGLGDDIVVIVGATESVVSVVDGECGRFGVIVVRSYNASGSLDVWETLDPDEGDLPGQVLMPGDTVLLSIEGTGCDWTFEWP